jgi:uncharacterized membrane protein YhaH (DUF805 family)
MGKTTFLIITVSVLCVFFCAVTQLAGVSKAFQTLLQSIYMIAILGCVTLIVRGMHDIRKPL